MDGNPFAATLGTRASGRSSPSSSASRSWSPTRTVLQNKEGTDYVAGHLIAAGELYGEEVTTC